MSRPLSRPSNPATMTSDKQNNGNLAKPFTPALSAAFHRNNKSPLTPKLANPGGYRTPRRYVQSEHPSSTTKDDPPAVGHNFLSANITPRSGSRTSRRDVATSSPTPSVSSYSPHTSYTQPSAPGSSVGGYRSDRSPVRAGGKLEPARAGRAKTLTAENNTSRPNSPYDASTGSRMFFHASDARSTVSSDPDTRPKVLTKSSSGTTFVYANGQEERRTPAAEEPVVVAPTAKRRSIGRAVSGAGKTPSASPRLRSAKISDPTARLSDSHSQIGSPIDDASDVGSQRHGLGLSTFPERPPPAPIGRHVKSSSVDSGSHSNSPRDPLRPSPIIISPANPHLDTSSLASEPLPALRPRIFSNESAGSADTYASGSQSPSKSETNGQSKEDPHARARTERKILDLEISNSSLLAINRTLEREMRKQTAELRRYRRLSRTGRISMAPSTRSVSGTALSVTSEMDEGVSELSSVRSPEDLSDFSDEESVVNEGVMSPADSATDQDSQHQVRDEKRFLVDLAKHQEVLADSQKMNQSLKRCLGWTEELIKEGKRALEYSVHVNDIELGGRVLAPEELAEVGESARGLLSPAGELSGDSTPEFNPDSTLEISEIFEALETPEATEAPETP